MTYEIFIHREPNKILRSLDSKTQERIKAKLHYLREDPYHERCGVDIKRIKGTNPVLRRLRVGDYRVIYAVEDSAIWITGIIHRSKAYL
jgi:mRNA interferase RelE/StbE